MSIVAPTGHLQLVRVGLSGRVGSTLQSHSKSRPRGRRLRCAVDHVVDALGGVSRGGEPDCRGREPEEGVPVCPNCENSYGRDPSRRALNTRATSNNEPSFRVGTQGQIGYCLRGRRLSGTPEFRFPTPTLMQPAAVTPLSRGRGANPAGPFTTGSGPIRFNGLQWLLTGRQRRPLTSHLVRTRRAGQDSRPRWHDEALSPAPKRRAGSIRDRRRRTTAA